MKYAPEEKAAVLAVLISCRGCVKKAARLAGVPRKALEYWSKGRGITPEVLKHVDEARRILRDKFLREADGALDAAAGKREAAGYRDLMIGAGVAVDKAQLLDGQPTAITDERRRGVLREGYVLLIERHGREPDEAVWILSDRLGVPLEEVKRIVGDVAA